MAEPLSAALVDRLRERAQDPTRRSGSSALATGATTLGTTFQDALAPPPDRSPEFQREVEEYLGGVNSPFAAMTSTLAAGDGTQTQGLLAALGSVLGGQVLAVGGQTVTTGTTGTTGSTASAEPSEPASEAEVVAAEGQLGFPLPVELRQYYLEVADGGVGPGDGLYGLAELVSKHHEMTEGPVGPQGQPWPAQLLPIQGQDWDLVSLDRETGQLVYWDLEELDDDDELAADQPTWVTSFVHEADSLAAWLGAWAD